MAEPDQAVLENPADQQAAAQQLRAERLTTLRTGRLTGTNPLERQRTNARIAPAAAREFAAAKLSGRDLDWSDALEQQRQQVTPEAARSIRRGNPFERTARLNALRSARKKSQALDSPLAQAQAQVNTAALQAYTQLWQRAHEIVEGWAFLFFMVGALLVAPLAMGMFLVRWIVGNGLEQLVKIEWRGFSVPLVPKMSPIEFAYRGAKNLFISFFFLLEWGILYVAFKIVTDPLFLANLSFKALTGQK